MSDDIGYGPPLEQSVAGAAPVAQPIVLAVDVRRGWQQAGTGLRLLLGLFVLLLVALVVFLFPDGYAHELPHGLLTVLIWAYLIVAPPAFYAAARVLRPYPEQVGLERPVRHGCAAVASAYGWAVLAVLFSGEWSSHFPAFAELIYFAVPSVLGPVTLLWGLLAAAVRGVSALR